MSRKVSVIMCHHLKENEKYLRAAIESVQAQTMLADLYVISSAETPYEDKLIRHHPELDNATKKVKYALDSLVDPAHDFILMSDDVVISPSTIAALSAGASLFPCIQNPVSNNEFGHKWFSPHMTMQNSYDYSEDMIKVVAETPASAVLMFPVEWLSFYCTYIPREVWNAVGSTDAALDVRWNDVDYCRRAAAKGINTFINTGGFALHFGSKTLPKVVTQDEYAAADTAFILKYPPQGLHPH